MDKLSYIKFPIFKNHPELFCVFSTRVGGFSKGKFSTMNMGLTSGDKIDIVKKNRKKWFELLNIREKKIAIPKQIHSDCVNKVTKPGIYSDTDALITNREDIFLSIQTADCLPIFIYEPEKKVIAVVHAGWQGALKGIVINTFEILINNYFIQPNLLKVAIGPGIQKSCFELREDVFTKFPIEFLSKHEDPKKRNLDLSAFVRNQLIENKVSGKNIYVNTSCTHCEQTKYYSYRRDKNHSGRMMGIIGFKKALNT